MKKLNRLEKKGFTLIEILVVVAIIAFIATLAIATVNNARKKARDAVRLADIGQIKKALELYYDKYAQYPPNGLSTGEVVGDAAGTFESDLLEFMPSAPADPLYDGTAPNDPNDYFYGWDITHNTCQPVLSINRFETQSALDDFGYQDTSSGGDMYINTAHYNYCPTLHR